ncbi:Pleiotropic drug resistance protein 13 [Triticum urartu]|uniref:Pleiotropic drug resistance protein 13 n=1 Tax=Triticum urartu TaxID=4572 RepID=M7ZZV9_TRIUA|nr:Pleiotropic drug resistance protein 13 [Triticum urartu]
MPDPSSSAALWWLDGLLPVLGVGRRVARAASARVPAPPHGQGQGRVGRGLAHLPRGGESRGHAPTRRTSVSSGWGQRYSPRSSLAPLPRASSQMRKKTRTLARPLLSGEGGEIHLSPHAAAFKLVGLEVPRVEVRFRNLRVSTEVNVGRRALPTLPNYVRDVTERILIACRLLHPNKHKLTILDDVSGIVRPGRMTLLLGPPASGKSTLLLALAGKLDPKLKKSGGITYNGIALDEFCVQRTSAYISQTDNHLGELTAASVGGDKHNLVTDYVLRVLGLDICADTLVGSDMERGVSGGQRKRVTTGEMIVGPRKTLLMDEISTGLDSSTTYQIVKCLRNFVHEMEATVLMSLLQPAPETFELFDDLILLSEGKIVYQGQIDHVVEYFKSLGFSLPPRKGIADFLQEVTSKKDQAQYWSDLSKPYSFIPVSAMAAAFTDSPYGRNLEFHPHNSDGHTNSPEALARSEFAISKYSLIRACFARELILISRHRFLYTFRTCQQRDNCFHPAWAFSLPNWILRIPYSIIEATVWSCVVYYTVGFAPTVDRFFRFMLLLFSIHQMALGLFRMMGAIARDMTIANTFGSAAMMAIFLLGGFIIPKEAIKPWWEWAYWVSPLMYGQRAISVNEFSDSRWSKVSSYMNNTIGTNVLLAHDLGTQNYWYWIGVGVLLAYALLFNVLFTLALAYLNPLQKAQALILANSEESKDLKIAGATSDRNTTTEKCNRTNVLEVSTEGTRRKGMLPFQPITMTFHNVNYFVDMPKEMKARGITEKRLQLLFEVSGVFRPRVLTALVGSSGAGKTTLMDVLAGRKTSGCIEGDIKISGHPKEQQTFARIAGYVEQNDIHSPQVTVEESLWFSSALRLPNDISRETKKAFVEEVMSLVELDELRHALVGKQGSSGLSTEQRKRLTIAVELVANPSIIFMDEPTSGLDARAAAIVMRTVRNAVDTGRTVVCTIHQPSIDIFESFDELLLLKRGGRVIYGGSLGVNSIDMIHYFQVQDTFNILNRPDGKHISRIPDARSLEGIPGVPPIREGYNPATWMLEVSTQACEERLGLDFATVYKNSDQFRNVEDLIEELSVPDSGSKPLKFTTEFSHGCLIQFGVCLRKQGLIYWRSPEYNVVRLFYTAIASLIFGSIFWNVGMKRNRNNLKISNSASDRKLGKLLLYLLYMFLTFTYFTFYGMVARIPGWWIWFYYICPVAWTLKGIITSQLGDVDTRIVGPGFDGTVQQFVQQNLGCEQGMTGVTIAVLIAFCVLFFSVYALSIKMLNFQRR